MKKLYLKFLRINKYRCIWFYMMSEIFKTLNAKSFRICENISMKTQNKYFEQYFINWETFETMILF